MRAATPPASPSTAAGMLRRVPLQRPWSREPRQRAAIDSQRHELEFPARVHGKVFFTIVGRVQPGDYVCSATAVRLERHTLAWTAGHCVDDAEFGGGFATNWIFVPGYRTAAAVRRVARARAC